jgi:AAA ATPase domain
VERAQRRVRGSVAPPTCPRATQAFVGREAELARFVELLDQAVLFLVYGVAGIGKSELAFRAVEVARERAGWDNAVSTLVQVQHGMDEQHLVAVLRLRTGAHRPPDRIGGPAPSLAEELEPVVRALNARPHLLVIDDLHLVDAAAAARVLGHLARHVRKTRIISASRLELPIPSEAVVTRLAPLAQPDAQKLVAGLGRRLGVEIADVAGILRRAGGSPFFLQREIVSSCANAAEPAEDPLDATLRALPVDEELAFLLAKLVEPRGECVRRKLFEVFHASVVTDDFRTSGAAPSGSLRHFLDGGQ